MAPISPPTPLSEREYDALADTLAEASPLDLDGLLGLLHAVALAPGLIPPSAWLQVLLPEGLARFAQADAQTLMGLVFRLHGDVLDAVKQLSAIIPDKDDVAGCNSFASGYTAGAQLDPEWIGDSARWSFAAPFAYLSGRHDLLTEQTIDDIERNLAPDPKAVLRRDLGTLIRATEESFSKRRRANSEAAMASTMQDGARRVGRNDPCPCGSGKKYKRCCIV